MKTRNYITPKKNQVEMVETERNQKNQTRKTQNSAKTAHKKIIKKFIFLLIIININPSQFVI